MPLIVGRKQIFAGLALLPICALSHAQSSVTLYGIVDAGLTYASNISGSARYTLSSGNGAGNRWGLRGNEDLGGGMSAVFDVENGFSMATGAIGQGGTFFGRQAYVGLSSPHGTLTMGRHTVPSTDYVMPFSSGSSWAGSGVGYGVHMGDVDNLDGTSRANNSIKYISRNYSGFSFSGLYSFGGVAGDFSRNQIYSVGAAYSAGPVKVAAGYLLARNPNFSFFGNNVASSTTGNNMTGSPTFAGYATARSQQIIVAGASYQLGSFTVATVYSNVQFKGLGETAIAGLTPAEAALRGTATFNTGELNLKYFVTPTLMVGTAYNYTKVTGGGPSSNYQQVNLGALYFLSKTTDLYALGFYQWAGGVNSTGAPAVASIGGAASSSKNTQGVIVLGIEKKF
ncbi:outer membrane porin OpcP [Caballeronia sordidicola]|uniref:Outer membrane porin OpcP n=1 Tax=Caballeronia sordidicola TaxID=196367 RepID=A0A158HP59_CABSO|nr:porin [Caballeronia sordidicola]SAL46066.1 outer membrane porin OpcP [Caballeronia sordidicola]